MTLEELNLIRADIARLSEKLDAIAARMERIEAALREAREQHGDTVRG